MHLSQDSFLRPGKYWLISCCRSLERIVREASANKEYERIGKIIDQLCHEYAYAVHQPHARNGGLIGLAAASIALGSVSVVVSWKGLNLTSLG